MSAFLAAATALGARIAAASDTLGQRVDLDLAQVCSRSGDLALKPPGVWSPNRSCRMVRAADGWIAVNLPRAADFELVPAWIGCRPQAQPWPAILRGAQERPWGRLVAEAGVLGLAVCGVGEIAAGGLTAPTIRMAQGRPARAPFRVIDLSSLWAGPLCGAVLALAGAEVTKIESRRRPDPARTATPAFFERFNGRKTHAYVDLDDPAEVERLGEALCAADVVITSARPRVFDQWGLPPERLFALNPGLTWVAVTGYGWAGPAGERIGFGDDTAAAGGLVNWSQDGAPRFAGDALADPLTGLAAAAGALAAVAAGGGVLVDASLARTAAGAASADTA